MKSPFLCWSSRLLVFAVQKIHGEVNALQIAAFDRQIARLGRAGRKDDGVKFLQQFFRRIIFPDLGVADELDAFVLEQLDAAQHDFLFVELHVRNAVHEQTAGPVSAFKNGHRWPALFNCAAALNPAGPEPMTATFLPVRFFGGSGVTQPFSQPWSIMRPRCS